MSRAVGVLVGLGVVLVLGRARAEEEPVPSLRADAALVRRLDGARDYIRAGDWAEATRALQALLEGADGLVPVKRGGEATAWVGLRAEAARTLAALPAAGREYYQTTYGPRARAMLVRARRQNDVARAAEVARRYPLTAAGAEAAGLVAVAHLDRGRDALAALCFERLLARPGADELPAALLFRAALAFRRAGDSARAERAWKEVAARAPAGLRLGGKEVSLAELKQQLDGSPTRNAEWGMGNERQSAGSAFRIPHPALEPRWSRPTAHEAVTRAWLQTAAEEQEDRGQPSLSAFAPLPAGGRVVYRSHRGLHAVDVATGKEAWEVASEWSADRLAAEQRHGAALETWVKTYLEVSPQVLAGNGVVGTLSTDGARVYAVDDLGVPPYPNYYRFRGRWRAADFDTPDLGPELTAAVSSSRLLALDTATGKPAWAVGRGAAVLRDHHFLGPPVAAAGRLYALAEKENEVALVCLGAADGALLWRQPLALAPVRLPLDPGRRVQVAVPVHAEGTLVCPTNAGLVVGVDLLTPGLAWAYPYRSSPLTQAQSYGGRGGRAARPRVTAEWPAAFTAVAGGRVVFAAPDEPSVHCLALRDGAPLWKAARAEDDLYVAGVFADRVLVVGKRFCRALALADGKQLWRVETGLPSGRGVAAGAVYYLPLKAAAGGKGPTVWGLDVRKGAVVARTALPREEAPGNLLLWRGEVLTQSATSLTAWRERKKAEDKAPKKEDGKKKPAGDKQ
jgi:outer membrane protein assembly factor BamB